MAEEMKYLVRIADTDLDGKKTILFALSRIKGVGVMFAHAACKVCGVDGYARIGSLSDDAVAKLDGVLKQPVESGIPVWLLNRRFDPESGRDGHLLSGALSFTIDNDVKQMKKMRCYKGIRHIQGAPVRGQRTRSNFRKNKGKVMGVKVASGAKKAGKV